MIETSIDEFWLERIKVEGKESFRNVSNVADFNYMQLSIIVQDDVKLSQPFDV
jgi:hypothetical protein